MTKFHVNGKVVDSVELLRKRDWRRRYISWLFALLYTTWIIVVLPSRLNFWDALIILGGVLALRIFVVLLMVWSVDFQCFVLYSKVKDIHSATACKVTPAKFCGSKELVPIHFRKLTGSLTDEIYFDFRNQCFIYSNEKKTFCKLPYPSKETFGYYLKSTGHDTEAKIQLAADKWGDNELEYPQPTFEKLMKEHCTEPLFVFQVFSVGLWWLDGYREYCLCTLFGLFVFEYIAVKLRLALLSDLLRVRVDSNMLMAYRCGMWIKVAGKDLVPGDVVSIGCTAGHNGVVPADMFILAGTAIVNEAILTGDSIPKWKVSITGRGLEEHLSLKRDRKHVIFCGTKILHHKPDKTSHMETPDGGCLAIVLRTGFGTTQRKLMRTILFSTQRVTTGNRRETRIFILFFIFIAFIAAGYLFKKGIEDPNRIRHELLLSCSLIITSSIPYGLPTFLSIAVYLSLTFLKCRGTFCTEPFRIPFAGKVDLCCFDKTGTLTSDSVDFSGVAGLRDDMNLETDTSNLPTLTLEILAFCQSLVLVGDKLVGDSFEKAAIKAVDMSNNSNSRSLPNTGGGCTLKSVQIYHFAPELKRMAVVVRREERYYAFVKGAPETIQERLNEIPTSYVSTYKRYTRQGSHVMALAYKPLPDMTVNEARNLDREVVESGLKFAGFAVFKCPIRVDSAAVLSELKQSSHDLVMITGDQALTACHVAREVNIISQPVLILVQSYNKQQYEWVSPDETEIASYSEETVEDLAKVHDLCIGGDCFEMLLQTCAFVKVIQYVKVFARVAPEQKELIMNTFKLSGRITLMCGDGTNDVGALKQAHIGVALLNAMPPLSVTATSIRHLSPAEREKLGYGPSAPVLKFGDTSTASPFTTKCASVSPSVNIIREGRNTLMITLQMLKILGLNFLVTTYGLSVMYLNGVKLGDNQATVSGLLTSTLFFWLIDANSRSKLSAQRPHPNVFCLYVFLSILGQLSLHLLFLNSSVKAAKKHMPEVYIQPADSQFEGNMLNTVVYMVSMIIRVTTFAVNYMGHPFNKRMSETTMFKYILGGAAALSTLITTDMFRYLNDSLMLVPLPREIRDKLLIWAAFTVFGCYTWERFLRWALPAKMPSINKSKSLHATVKKAQ